jgi:hypothetical protein
MTVVADASLVAAPFLLGDTAGRPALALAAIQDHLEVLVVGELLREELVEILPVGRNDAEVAGPWEELKSHSHPAHGASMITPNHAAAVEPQ